MILTSLNPEIEPIYRANAITGSAVCIAKGFALKLLSLATFELQNLRYNIFPSVVFDSPCIVDNGCSKKFPEKYREEIV